MKKQTLIIPIVAATVAFSGTGAMAAHGHGGHHGAPHHSVVHVNYPPQPGHVIYIGGDHHHGHHHGAPHYYYRTKTGDIIMATALLVSALM